MLTEMLLRPIVSIVGTGSYYPPNTKPPEHLEDLISTYYDIDPILKKTLEINKRSRIQQRHFAIPDDDPYWKDQNLPNIADCDAIFKQYGVPMAEQAARKALGDWGGSHEDITHLIAVTCTNTANPGFDFMLCERLGLHRNVQRTLLHGVGCAGGVAALRTANELLLGVAALGKTGRALVVTCELVSIFFRAELDGIVRDQEVNIGVTLFGDGAGALVLSNGIGTQRSEKAPLWNILNARSTILENSAKCLEFNVHPHGYHAVISKDVPKHVSSSLPAGFEDLIASTPLLCSFKANFNASSYDWALHPGGYGVLLRAQDVLNISEHHLRQSYDVYQTHGNTSSATILSIIHELAVEEGSARTGHDKVVVGAFGPGMTMEMAVMTRVT
ncbi:thiolase-like protein [Penicillium cataractarum]|uniref:Thiolase-like protein n=1 Tax=Penicillium cataractarum TaxID=2100454 RepID=A0A9W9V119_9EURO|nr:thiolase-like protein [Penicillium cataractarum]KAJ5363804.1 thiolase-like protein [Penicillium cataractarum]